MQIGYQAPVFARRIRAIATVGIRALPARRFMPPPPGCRSWVPGSSSCTHTQNQRNCYLWNQSPTSRAPLSCSRIICPCVSLPHAHRARSPPSLRDAGSPPPDPKAPSHHERRKPNRAGSPVCMKNKATSSSTLHHISSARARRHRCKRTVALKHPAGTATATSYSSSSLSTPTNDTPSTGRDGLTYKNTHRQACTQRIQPATMQRQYSHIPLGLG